MNEPASATKRVRKHRSPNRDALLDAVERVIVTEGYAALSSRRVAEEAGLKHQLLFYYFPTFDDLLLEVLRRGSQSNLRATYPPLDPAKPLQSIWQAARNPISNRWLTEFMALANHSEAIREELLAQAERLRVTQIEALEQHLPEDVRRLVSPAGLSVLVAILSRGLALEEWMGLQTGHSDADAMIQSVLERLDAGQLTQF